MATTFQILNLFSRDENIASEEEEYELFQHFIYIFGRTFGEDSQGSQTVCVKTPFQPYFFLEMPESFTTTQIMDLSECVKKLLKGDLVSVTPVKRTKFVGFTNQKEYPFLRVILKSKKAMYKATKACTMGIEMIDRRRMFPLYESNIDPILRFLHITDLQSCGVVSIPDGTGTIAENSVCDIDLYVESFRDIKPVQAVGSAPFVLCSFDIEVYSHDDSFPKASVPENVVFQIACTFQRFGETEPYKKSILNLGSCNPIEGVEVICAATERDLLLEFPKILRREQIDVILGYNIWGFDFKYLFERAKLCRCTDAFSRISKLEDFPSEMYKKTFSSGAYGTTEHELPLSPGIFQIDLLVTMRRDYKLDSYKLDNVAEHFLGEHKLDVTPKQIFAAYRSGDVKKVTNIADYCVQDTMLPLRLIDKLAIFLNMVEMANVTYVPIDYLILRGQQIKCFSQITRETRKQGMLVKVIDKNNGDQEFQGATVLEPKRGFYKEPISCLDFASLYPSIMRAHKLCHSNWVNTREFANVPGVEYFTMEWYDENHELHKHIFAQKNDGVLPGILEYLAKSRTQAKKDMKNAKTPFEKAIYNGKQLAYKVSMNSLYGFCGAVKTGMLPCKAISETVTARGREMIMETKNFVETNYVGTYVVYGDSVSGDTPLLLRLDGHRLTICTFESLAPAYHSHGTKEIAHVNGKLEVWTENGFTQVRNVIRHKTTKQMYRVITPTGIVDVTEDHSLLLETGEEVSPKDVQVGTRLLHHSTRYANRPNIDMDLDISPHIARLIAKCIHSGGPVDPVERDMIETMYPSGRKKLEAILNSPGIILRAFWDTYCTIHGVPIEEDRIMFRCETKEVAFIVTYVAQCMGFHCRVSSDQEYFAVTCSLLERAKYETRIEHIVSLGPCDGYVYDLTTANHHFHVGPGNLVVHNTDSVFCNFSPYIANVLKEDPRNMELQFKVGFEAGERCSEIFKRPVELEFEKTYFPLLLQNKKRYAGLMYECSDWTTPAYIDKKGLSIIRRDSCKFSKESCMEVLEVIMRKIDVMEARRVARLHVENLLSGQVDLDKLVVSKSLREKYASENLPHVFLAKKLEQRNPGSGPKSPERVPYLFIDSNDKEQFKRAEDPEYVKQNKLKVDYLYYFEHQFKNPLESLFELISEDHHTMFEDIVRKYLNKKKKQMEITSFFTVG